MNRQRSTGPSAIILNVTGRSRGALIAVVAGTVLLVASLVVRLIAGPGSGSLADWIESLATLGAFSGAVWAAVYAKQAVEIEQARDQRRERTERRSQAIQVAAWNTYGIDHHGGEVTVTAGIHGTTQTQVDVANVPMRMPVEIRNASELPTPHFTCDLYVRPRDSRGEWLYVGSHDVGTIPPKGAMTVEAIQPPMVECMHEVLDPLPGTRGDALAEVILGWTLTDNAGRVWRRQPPGIELVEVESYNDLRIVSEND